MKALRFHPEAETELVEAAIWYEEQQQGLGQRFLTCVQDALSRTLLNPELYPFVDGDVRRCLTKTFSFWYPLSCRERADRSYGRDAPASRTWLLEIPGVKTNSGLNRYALGETPPMVGAPRSAFPGWSRIAESCPRPDSCRKSPSGEQVQPCVGGG